MIKLTQWMQTRNSEGAQALISAQRAGKIRLIFSTLS